MSLDPRQANPVGILLGLVIVGGILMAFLLGSFVAHGDLAKIGIFAAGTVAAAICLGLGKKVWLLIPLTWLLSGKISVLPLPFSVHDLGIFAAFATFAGLMVFKKLPPLGEFKKCDLLLFLNLFYLGTVYLRNPVGTQAMGSEMVGGRPYLDVLVALLAYWVLHHVVLNGKEAKYLPFLMSLGATVVGALGILTMKFPSLVPIIAPFYSGIDVSTYMREQSVNSNSPEVYRATPLLGFGTTVGNTLISYFRPQQLILFLRPFWSLLYYFCFLAILLSGFRSALVGLGLLSLLSSYFFGGLRETFRMLFALLAGVLLVVTAQSAGVYIPLSVQRALSFIPIEWDERATHDAQSSSEWRYEIWKIALDGDKYIKHKILGDGFGYSQYELQIQMQAAWGGPGYIGGNEAEAQLVSGAYHSGPLSAIRYVGAFGLLLFTILLIATACYAWTLIGLTKNTALFPLALFAGLPAIYKPFEYLFIFGQFDSDLPKAIFTLALLNMAHRSLGKYREDNTLPAPARIAPGEPNPQTGLPFRRGLRSI